MAVTATKFELAPFETPPVETFQGPEIYARSTRVMRALGEQALNGVLTGPEVNSEALGSIEESFGDFSSGVEENLATDDEYGELLDFNPIKHYRIVDNVTVDKMGQPVIDMVGKGLETSRTAAKTDPEMVIQEERDEGDVVVAHTVNDLRIGEMYAVVSMDPKEAIRRNPKYWQDKMGYRYGMAIGQIFYRKDETTMLAITASIKQSNPDALRRIFARRGKIVPENISDGQWTRHGIRQNVTMEEAVNFGATIQTEHSKEIGQQAERFSVTDFLRQHQGVVYKYFNNYIVPLAKARASGENNETMSNLAQTLLNHPSLSKKFGLEETHQLKRLANTSLFTVDDASFMEQKIRYALVEELRTKLPEFMKSKRINTGQLETAPLPPVITELSPDAIQHMNHQLAGNIARGVEAGRTYGGCTGADGVAAASQGGIPGLQDVFGGKAEAENNRPGEDKYGSRTFECPKGHTNHRPYNKLIKECQKCGMDVSCGMIK